MCEGCCANYSVTVGLLIGQGWKPKLPNLPKQRREQTKL